MNFFRSARPILLGAAVAILAFGQAIAQGLDESYISKLQWRSIGPGTMGGRVIRIAIDAKNHDTWYVATASGGLWKTTNAGKTFTGLFQHEEVNSIGDMAVSRSHPNVVWIGTGENNPRNSSIYGKGVYKSVDGGQTWENMGLEDTRHIGRMAIHHTNPDIVYVGAMGRTWGPNEERGLYKTTNGGKSWEKILYVDDQTGIIEVEMHPTDPDTLLVATWQRERDIYDVGEPAMSDGPGSGVWKTTDGGKNWTRLNGANGLPTGKMGRTGITWSVSNPNIVYLITGGARLEQSQNGVWKSTNGGDNWTKVNDIAPRPMYYSQIRVDPKNPDIVFVLGVQLARSTDGGNEFSNLRLEGVHVDHHALQFHPTNSQRVLLGNDGGFYVSDNGGNSFEAYKKMAIGQFYHVAVDNRRDYWVGGGLQDNGTYYGPSMLRGKYGPQLEHFRSINGGDGFVVRFHPDDHRIVYAESQNGNYRRLFLGPRDEAPTGTVRRGRAPQGERETWAWKTDFILSHHDPNVFYAAGQYVYKSTDGGVNQTRVSPRLPLTDGGSATAIIESPINPNLLYAGTDDGALWRSRDAGRTWTAIHNNVPIPVKCYVSTLEASRFAEGRIYATFDAHRSNDDRPFLYVSEDYGQTWTSLNANLPEFGSTRCLREDPINEDVLYCGTEFFAWLSVDRGATWTKFNNNLPTVAVHDFAISNAAKELVAGTHGRSLWALDISWLQQFTPSILTKEAHLFFPHSAVLWETEEQKTPEEGALVGENPPFGATIYYHLGADQRNVRMRVMAEDGSTVAELRASGDAGLNSAFWDLTNAANGRRVLPGSYRVVLDVNGKEHVTAVTVELDPENPAARRTYQQAS